MKRPPSPPRGTPLARPLPVAPTGTGGFTRPRHPPGQEDQDRSGGPPTRPPAGRDAPTKARVQPHRTAPPRRTKAVNEWRGLAHFCGMILDVGDKFTQAFAALDEEKCFNHATFKESCGLPRPYYLEFVNRVASQGSTIHTNTISQKARKPEVPVSGPESCVLPRQSRDPQQPTYACLRLAAYSHSLFLESTA